MFNNLNQNQNKNVVDDIFAETDEPIKKGASNNIEAQPAGLSAPNELSAGNQVIDEDNHRKNKSRMIIILVLSVVVLGAAIYLVYAKLMQPVSDNYLMESDVSEANVIKNNESDNVNQVVDNNIITPQSEEPSILEPITPAPGQPTVPSEPLVSDTDGDGLSDEEEARLGTNPLNPDSDGDGLTDYQEVMTYGTNPLNPDSDGDGLTDYQEVVVYGTDPLNPDSDGDGYLDGEEVNNGYNPLGDGLLNELN